MTIWQSPQATLERPHGLKYSLFYGRGGKRTVGYDNERGKGDHKHLLDVETRYKFVSVEKMVADFLADIERLKMSTTNKVHITVGSLADMGKRFAGAWNRAAAGERIDETHVTFLDVKTMLDTLSPRRLELLRFVRQHGAGNVRLLAQALQRDYKNVYQDVATLEAAGLLLREGRKLTAPWDELQANVSLMAA